MAELRRSWAAQPRVFGLRSFMEPGFVKIDPAGPFRDNVRTFLSEFAAEQSFAIDGMATWLVFLSDEKSGRVFSLYTVEDQVRDSPQPFCDYCRSTGWSHHFVSKRKYHLIIPAESDCDGGKPLDDDSFLDSETHLLHGLIHCNGYGHLLALNGYEHGSKPLRGHDLLDLFDRICAALCVKEMTVEDESKMRKMDLRLLHAVAYGRSWFGKWGYRLRHGSFGITPNRYQQAIKVVSSITLDKLVEDFGKVGRDRGLKRIISTYQSSSPRNAAPLLTLGDLLRRMLDLKALLPFEVNRLKPPPVPLAPEKVSPAVTKMKTAALGKAKKFNEVAKKLDSRWSVRRMEHAAEVVVEALKGLGRKKGMTRQDVRDAARLEIGDTGLIDFVLKSIGGCVVGSDIVRRTINATTRTLEFYLQDAGAGKPSPEHSSLTPPTPAVEEPVLKETVCSRRNEVERDVWYVYRQVFDEYPPEAEDVIGIDVAVGVIRDCKHFSKTWLFVDNAADDNLRYHCGVIADAADLEFVTDIQDIKN